MAVRGIMATITAYPEIYTTPATPLYQFQNHFETSPPNFSSGYIYNSFTVTPVVSAKNSSAQSQIVTFAATAANIDFVEAAIANRYELGVILYRWGQNIDTPVAYNILAFNFGYAAFAESDFTSISLTISEYSDNRSPDFPWRKIPWTILGPLGIRS